MSEPRILSLMIEELRELSYLDDTATCDVCDGSGDTSFYMQVGVNKDRECRACDGKGVVLNPEKQPLFELRELMTATSRGR